MPNKDLIQYYALRAAEYNRVYQKPERQVDLQQMQQFLPKQLAHKKVLEIGCGTGYWTVHIAEKATEVLATDINTEVLKIAQRQPYVWENVTFQQVDMYDLKGVEGTFDAIFAGFIWSHVSVQDLPDLLSKLRQKLNPGGQFVFVDNNYVPGSSTPIAGKDSHGNTFQLRKLEDGSSHQVLKNFPSDEALEQMLGPFVSELQLQRLPYYWVLSGSV